MASLKRCPTRNNGGVRYGVGKAMALQNSVGYGAKAMALQNGVVTWARG
jgi:hypothetical protein